MTRLTGTRHNPNLRETIRETAWRQLAESGTSSLSLRAIARELGITAPAIYNYYPDRDALVTSLIIEAYSSFGDCQLQARDGYKPEQVVERFCAIGRAYREWALSYPQRYQLIFGWPIPGYHPPLPEILPSSARSLSALVSVVDDLRAADRLRTESFPLINFDREEQFSFWKACLGGYHILSLSVSMLVWSRVHGLVSLEIAGSLPPFGETGNALYHFEMQSIARQLVKE
jgi:AcrR family transcriptional regulator